jgi:hypothetical protein
MSAVEEYRQLAPAYAEVESPADYVKGLADCAIAELEAELAALKAENDALIAKGTPGWKKLRELEVQRDEANTGAIAQRRSFEKALDERDRIIAGLNKKGGEGCHQPTIPLDATRPPRGSIPPGGIDWRNRAEQAEAELVALIYDKNVILNQLADMENRAMTAKVELAALKARRCETCRAEDGCVILSAIGEWGLDTPQETVCLCWTAREDGES